MPGWREPGWPSLRRPRVSSAFSFRVSFGCGRGGRLTLDHPHRAVARLERCVGYSADVGGGDLLDALDVAEQLAPVAADRLGHRQLEREAGVAVELTEQRRLRP